MNGKKAALDPFRVILSLLESRANSDLLQQAVNSSGLIYDTVLTEAEEYSHKTRIRALVPRVIKAYDALDSQNQLAVARAVFVTVKNQDVIDALNRIGWAVQGNDLVVTTPDLREMFFPKGSPWDAHVVLKGLFNEAKYELIIIDSYADTTIFQMLSSRPLAGLTIKILCSQYATALSAEAQRFIKQYTEANVEIKKSTDFHDRFIIIDEKSCIHLGASIKDAGKTACLVSRLEDEITRSALLSSLKTAWERSIVV